MFLKFKLGIAFFIATVVLGIYGETCDRRDQRFGCKIDHAKCSCDWGCKSEFPYVTINACKAANFEINGHLTYCWNGGKYFENENGEPQCDCTGTDYFGSRCLYELPFVLQSFQCLNQGRIYEHNLGGYTCYCLGTGYYGIHCEHKEPALE